MCVLKFLIKHSLSKRKEELFVCAKEFMLNGVIRERNVDVGSFIAFRAQLKKVCVCVRERERKRERERYSEMRPRSYLGCHFFRAAAFDGRNSVFFPAFDIGLVISAFTLV